jgi:choline-sulfatase
MRILYLDIDTLRPDHLGCYGYHRPTSPNIDTLAAEGIRFDGVHVSDSPCLPSRTALSTGRFGRRTGVVNHGGARAELFPEGRERRRRRRSDEGSWAARLQSAGLRTASISSFASRHSAWHWHAGFDETFDPGRYGRETADEVFGLAASWLARHGQSDAWFLHVHFWDPHTPYRTPPSYGDPLGGTQSGGWIDAAQLARLLLRTGPHSASEPAGWTDGPGTRWQPARIDSLDAVRAVYSGYDTGIHYVDAHVGRLMNVLADLGVEPETAVLVSSDHGESLGELGIWSDHQTADTTTHRVPAILRWPGVAPGWDSALRYQFDLSATLAELAGARLPGDWDGASFAGGIGARSVTGQLTAPGRAELVLSCAAWTVQRSVRFGRWLCVRTYHDGFHGFPEWMLFDAEADPHELDDRAADHPEVVAEAAGRLAAWSARFGATEAEPGDPLVEVLEEGGGLYVRDQLERYLLRLEATGRGGHARALRRRSSPFGRI